MRRSQADFHPERFEHVAAWDPDEHWIEMRLRAMETMSVRLAAVDMTVEFCTGEEMRTEIYLLTLARPALTG